MFQAEKNRLKAQIFTNAVNLFRNFIYEERMISIKAGLVHDESFLVGEESPPYVLMRFSGSRIPEGAGGVRDDKSGLVYHRYHFVT
jgi:hypothetical protein